MLYYARPKAGRPQEEWQLLQNHLQNVAAQAAEFATPFGGQALAAAAGWLHDAGKYSDEFQRRVRGAPISVDHSTVGGQLAVAELGAIGYLLAYAIMGHHGRMPNRGSVNQANSVECRLLRSVPDASAYKQEVQLPCQSGLPWIPKVNPGFSCSFLARMLFSCLVDADRLDAECFTDMEKALQRDAWPSLIELGERMDAHMARFTQGVADTPVNRERAHVLDCCRRAAAWSPGLFTLTVPTGGGKTLSSLDFALRHARLHGFKSIIYAIPFTSIISQTAGTFRAALGTDAVLEHHSNLVYQADEEENKDNLAFSLATENWDAPIIVTTNVQFFESLFSNRASQCRKLHNVAESIVILDEAQSIPDDFLRPCLAALEELSLRYQTSIVLCTATQPNLTGLWPFGSQPREIIPDAQRLYMSLKRVEVSYRGAMTDEEVVKTMQEQAQALCIVNTRQHAADLFTLLGDESGHFHLSARMCPKHRDDKLREIKESLQQNRACRVISTQLIEAGVDVDFPLVLRATAGIDSIAQAAGRCNREGKQKLGQTYVFDPEPGLPRGWFRRMAELGRRIMQMEGGSQDPLALESVKQFFTLRYDLDAAGLDKHDILPRLEEEYHDLVFPFQDIADDFKFIDDFSCSIIIPYDDAAQELLQEIEASDQPGVYQRQLQRYSVGVHPQEFAAYWHFGWLRCLQDMYYVLDNDTGYDKQKIGLRTIDAAVSDFLAI